jgi:hypothetical protein
MAHRLEASLDRGATMLVLHEMIRLEGAVEMIVERLADSGPAADTTRRILIDWLGQVVLNGELRTPSRPLLSSTPGYAGNISGAASRTGSPSSPY